MGLQRSGRRFTGATRIPRPMQDHIMSQMLCDFGIVTVPVQFGIAKLVTNRLCRLTEPVSLYRRKPPVICHRRRTVSHIGIFPDVTGCTGQGFRPDPAFASADVHAMGTGTPVAFT